MDGQPARGPTWLIYDRICQSVKNKYQQNTWFLMLKSVTVSDVGMFILLVSQFGNVTESVDMCSGFIVKRFF